MKLIYKLPVIVFTVVMFSVFPENMQAHTSPIVSFVRNGKVYLRWKPERSTALEGCNVYRKTADENWIKCTLQPIERITNSDEIHQMLGTQSKVFFQLMGVQFPQKGIDDSAYSTFLQSKKQVSNFDLMCQIYPDFPRVMGEMYVDTSALKGVSIYKITAIEYGVEQEIAVSRPLNSSVNDTIPEILTLEAIPKNERVLLRWKRNDNALDAGIVNGYNIYRSVSLLGNYERVNSSPIFPVRMRVAGKNPTAEQQFVDKLVQNGTEYFYVVRSVNAFGFESESSITARTIPFATNTEVAFDISAEQFGNGVMINFLAGDSANFADVELWKSTNQASGYKKVFPQSEFQLQRIFYDMDIREGEHYFYYAIGKWKNGEVRQSDTLLFIRPDKSPPDIPQGLSAKNKGAITVLTWKKNNESDIEGYEIRRSVALDTEKMQFALTDKLLQTNTFNDSTKNSERGYRYYVYAVDKAGNYSKPAEIEVLPLK